ncbi:MAG: flagellin [Methanospirillum sp.]|uniref:hypothetical protein n=1 Tax=Methanospirillum sp. TaxID=45200 RepID=UPI00236C18CF|nr:hypothetical protein [Methanospirillum sp.]MDD1728701.1 flagellin [Methanospirillum sp.]
MIINSPRALSFLIGLALVCGFAPGLALSDSDSNDSIEMIAGDVTGFGGAIHPTNITMLQLFLRSPEDNPVDLTHTSFYLSTPSGISQLTPASDFSGLLTPGRWNISPNGRSPIIQAGEIGTIYIMPESPITPGSRISITVDTGIFAPVSLGLTVPSLVSQVTPLLKSSADPVYDFESFGNVYGYDSHESGKVSQIEVPFRLTAGHAPVNMSNCLMVTSNASTQMILQYDQSGSSGLWNKTCLFCDSDNLLEEGELWVLNLHLSHPFRGGDSAHLQIIPVDSESAVIAGSVPLFAENTTQLSLSIPSTNHPVALIHEERAMELVGAVYGVVQDARLQKILLHLSLADGGNPVDLTNVKFSYSTNESTEWLNYSAESASQGEWNVSGILAGDSDKILTNGEIVDITLVPKNRIISGGLFTLQLLPDTGRGYYLNGYFSDEGTNTTLLYPGSYLEPQLVLSGYIYGTIESAKLSKIKIYLINPEGFLPLNLSKAEFLWSSTNQMLPVRLVSDIPDGKILASGDTYGVNLTIGSGQGRISGGESFTLEIMPDVGSSTIISKTLSSGYVGGVIY